MIFDLPVEVLPKYSILKNPSISINKKMYTSSNKDNHENITQ